ncbi:MAG TPA: DUF1361 domain-containing protein, partial [Acidimicrobiales bacterium]|nr:DUF1361 domain-containing protein [Acidimicrobiales bacterium]
MGAVVDGLWSGFTQELHWQLPWMGVNFVLAVLPVIGAYALHRWWRRMGPLRWPLLGMVALLLPNAPYVVTDLIHVRESIRWAPNRSAVYAGIVPLFSVLIATGVLGYAYTLHLMRKHMRLAGWSRRRRVVAEVGVSVFCAVGVALGRISRLNSWDVFRPDRLVHGLHRVSLDPRSVVLSLL